MEIIIKIKTEEQPPTAKLNEQSATVTEPVIQLSVEEWKRRQSARHAEAA